MAIQNRKKIATIISIILVIAFVLSAMIYGWTFLRDNVLNKSGSGAGSRRSVATVNGENISGVEYLRELETISSHSRNALTQKKEQMAQLGMDTGSLTALSEETMQEYVIQTLVDRRLLLTAAKDLKVNVTNKEVDEKIKTIESQAGGKQNLLAVLQQRGYRTLKAFKEDMKKEMIINKVQETIMNSHKITEEEMKKVYERYRYTAFADQSYEESKKQIEEFLKEENTVYVSSYLAKARESAKIKFKNNDIKKIYEKSNSVIAEKDGYKMKKLSLNDQIVTSYFSSEQPYTKETEENMKKSMQKRLEGLVEVSKKAKEAGIKAGEGLVGVDELSDYSKKYYTYLIDSYNPSEEVLMARFNEKKESYNTKNTISGNVVGNDFQASEKDFEAAKKQADELMKTVTKENFAQKAKEVSKDPGSAVNGGSLGDTEIDLAQLVPEFAEAVKKAKDDEIVGPVKTQFGYHLIYVHSKNKNNENLAKVSHILLTPTVSEETKQAAITELKKLKEELDSKKVTWEKVEKQDKYKFDVKEQFKKLAKGDPIPGVGKYDDKLMDQLFASKIGDVIEHQTEYGYFLLGKTAEIQAKEAVFADVRERVRLELAFENANKEFEKFNN